MALKRLLPAFILFILICSGCAGLHEASSTGDIGRLNAFLQDGADVNAKDNKGVTPLMLAASYNRADAVKILIEKGADVNLKNHKGKTAMDYAFDQGNFNIFKILMENGAISRININERVLDSNAKKQFHELLKEYSLYKKLLKSGSDSINNFDAYFSYFSKGYYTKSAEDMFQSIVKEDYEKAVTPPDPENIKDFIRKYSSMGKNYFLINSGSLNIRSGPSVETESRGSYYRGDRVYAINTKDGWIQTEQGWISLDFVKPIQKIIPVVQAYIKKADGILEKQSPPPPAVSRKELTAPAVQKIKPAPSPSPVQAETGFFAVENELKNLLENANLKDLEVFIKKYKDKNEYKSLVNTAREKYKSILLGN